MVLVHCFIRILCILFISFFGLTRTSTSASVSGNVMLLSVKKRVLAALTMRLRSHIEQYNVFKLLYDTSYDTSFGFLAFSRPRKCDWSRCESSLYPHDFNAGLVISVWGMCWARPETSERWSSVGGSQTSKDPLNIFKCKSMSLLEVKLQGHQFLVRHCPADLEGGICRYDSWGSGEYRRFRLWRRWRNHSGIDRFPWRSRIR